MSNVPPRPTAGVLPPIHFEADGPSDEERTANLETVLASPGFASMALILADAIVKRADVIVLDFTVQQVGVRYQVDGFWHTMPTLDRESGDFMLASLKRLANLDIQERRARQDGKFKSEFLKKRFNCRIISQGVKTGERVAVYIDRKKPSTERLDECGMRAGLIQRLKLLLGEQQGLILVSGLPGDGFTTSWRATIAAADLYMRDFFVVEEKSRPEPEIINVTSVSYDSSQQDDPTTILPRLLLRQPDAIALTEIENAKIINTYCDLVNRDGKFVFMRTHAKNTIDAILRVLAKKPKVEKFSEALLGVVCHRLIRKLCPKCKKGYVPSPQLMQQMGLPPGRVAVMYQRYDPKPEDLVDEQGRPIEYEPCTTCGGIGFLERTGIFELLVINDEIRNVINKNPKPDALFQVARKNGFVSMREEGILLAAQGLISVDELQRVMNK